MSSRCEALVEAAPQSTDAPYREPSSPGRAPRMLGGNESTAPQLDGDCWVEVIRPREVTAEVAADWDGLAADVGSPNIFYERWNLLSAVKHVARDVDVELALVYRRAKKAAVRPRLCGLFPLFRSRSARLPISAWKLFSHPYAYLQTPLVRVGQEYVILSAFLDWAGSLPGGPGMLHWSLISGEGPFAQALTDAVDDRGLVSVIMEHRTRAILRRKENWEDAAATSLSSHHRREMRRQHRRLMELGDLSLRVLNADESLQAWQQDFLQLEHSGWKGEQGTAMAADPQSRDYFLDVTAAAHKLNKLQMMGLYLNGQPLAMRVGLCTGRGSFAWKIAFDEQHGKYSPGVQLEIENVRHFHDETDLEWMDSCAKTQHFMINRIWSDRRIVQHMLISLGGRLTNLAVGGLPFARAVKRSLQRKLPAQTSR